MPSEQARPFLPTTREGLRIYGSSCFVKPRDYIRQAGVSWPTERIAQYTATPSRILSLLATYLLSTPLHLTFR